jgi:glycerate 2-kinase
MQQLAMPKKVLIAPNAFKGTMSAITVAQTLAKSLAGQFEVQILPLSDGGDGFVDVIHYLIPELTMMETEVTGPLANQRVKAKWLWDASNMIAYIESAQACGLSLMNGQLNPMETTSRGLGELIVTAISKWASDIYVGLGGTASTDGGVGAMQALGWQFPDQYAKEVGPGGGKLIGIHRILPGPQLSANINLMTDVNNPLLGDLGTAPVFAPQKGATPDQVLELERGLSNLWLHAYKIFNLNLDFPGSGAAGGIPAGFALSGRASVGSGFELIADLGELEEKIAWADIVVTGEGKFDQQSTMGKAPGQVVNLARSQGKRVAIVAGVIENPIGDINIELTNFNGNLEQAGSILAQELL